MTASYRATALHPTTKRPLTSTVYHTTQTKAMILLRSEEWGQAVRRRYGLDADPIVRLARLPEETARPAPAGLF